MQKSECGDFPLTDEVRLCMVETVNQLVLENFPFATQKGVDLKEFSKDLHSLLALDLDDFDFVIEMSRTISTLRDGHTRLERFRLGAKTGKAPVDYRLVGDRVLITAVFDDGLGVEVGDEIVAIEDRPAREYLQLSAALYEVEFNKLTQMHGPSGLLDGPADSVLKLEIAGRGEVQMRRRFHLPSPSSNRFGDIGYINVSTFGFIDDLDRLDGKLNELMETSALIIDLRGNGGGYPSVTDGLFGRLIDSDVPGFDMVDVRGKHKRTMHSKPRGETYDKPVVVLTDPRTYSASNYFAQRLVYHGRGMLIGERTGGGSASPEQGAMLVPGVWFQVSTYVVQTPEGVNAEEGIDPDIEVEYRPDDGGQGLVSHELPAGDRVLSEAIRYLEKTK
ncbi:MAG: S41 family peptidase [Bradymonadaceae bacterium]